MLEWSNLFILNVYSSFKANLTFAVDVYWAKNEPSGLKNGNCSVLRQSLWYVTKCEQSHFFFCATKQQGMQTYF